MTTKIATARASGDPQTVASTLLKQIEEQLQGQIPKLICTFASNSQPLQQLLPTLQQKCHPETKIIGAGTAGEFTQHGCGKNSTAIFALAGDYKIYTNMATGLKNNLEQTVQNATQPIPKKLKNYPYRTAILLLDALSGNAEEAALLTASYLEDPIRLAGGAAGDYLEMKYTPLGCGQNVSNDALVIALIFSKKPLGVGVKHGHTPISKPIRITKSKGNIVYEIEHKPAWQAWKELTQEAAQKHGLQPDQLSGKNATPYLIQYEAGLSTGTEYKIRAPLLLQNDGSISFACGIPEGTTIRITESLPQRQIQSAKEAAKLAKSQIQNSPLAGALVFDCCCRYLILKENFNQAIHAISQELGNIPLAGFETYGEIALDVGEMSGFHNTTTVVLAFPK